MATQMLCGDEVRAAVVDFGSSSCKIGAAGQDTPRHVFRTDIGIVEDGADGLERYIVGDSALRIVRENMEITKPNKPGNYDWNAIEMLLRYGVKDCMRNDAREIPLLFAEGWFSRLEDKERLVEMCFESLQSPAFYMMANGALSSFSTGRPSSVVVDFGAAETRVIPVVDGYVLNKAVICTNRGGNNFDDIMRKHIEGSSQQKLRPWYELDGKVYPTPSQSFRDIYIVDIVRDIKRWLSFVPYKPITGENRTAFMAKLPVPPYELPDGNVVQPSDELCTVAEKLWFSEGGSSSSSSTSRKAGRSKPVMGLPAHSQPVMIDDASEASIANATSTNSNSNKLPLHELLYTSLAHCDVEVRRELLNNIILVGGGANIDGVGQRLIHELTNMMASNYKVKLASNLPIERQFAPWIGGSVLSICGSFQQLWVSRADYEEHGAGVIARDRLVH